MDPKSVCAAPVAVLVLAAPAMLARDLRRPANRTFTTYETGH